MKIPYDTFETLSLQPEKKIYFVSDFHLGAPNTKESLLRERRIVSWLDEISKDAQTIFLLGDIFDFWFEYKHVVPKGFVRVLGKLAEMTDKGIEIHLFTGNHDLWTFGYLEREIGMKIHIHPKLFRINETLCFIGHGDGLGPGDKNFKCFKKIFSIRLNQRLYAFLHPWIGVGLASYLSKRKRIHTGENDANFTTSEKESLYVFCRTYLQRNPNLNVRYFIFGHRHLPLEIEVSEHSTYFNTGDWLTYGSFLEMSDGVLRLVKG